MIGHALPSRYCFLLPSSLNCLRPTATTKSISKTKRNEKNLRDKGTSKLLKNETKTHVLTIMVTCLGSISVRCSPPSLLCTRYIRCVGVYIINGLAFVCRLHHLSLLNPKSRVKQPANQARSTHCTLSAKKNEKTEKVFSIRDPPPADILFATNTHTRQKKKMNQT